VAPTGEHAAVWWWDRLDILYFAAYAVWTYVSTPFLFAREDYQVVELDPWVENGEHWRRLAVTFPEHVHTHSREQVFYIDANDGLIRRHDYTAEPIGGWAKAAHYCLEQSGRTCPQSTAYYAFPCRVCAVLNAGRWCGSRSRGSIRGRGR
jgi:hypothetical protein